MYVLHYEKLKKIYEPINMKTNNEFKGKVKCCVISKTKLSITEA